MRIFLPLNTDNNIVDNVVAIIVAAVLALILFPVHITNYVYVNSDEKFAGISVRLFGFLRVKNINTIKNVPNKMLVDGKEKDFDGQTLSQMAQILFENTCLTKIIQLGDYGICNNSVCYVSAAQNALSAAVYTYLRNGGCKGKLKNYTILNKEHGNIVYYAKICGAANLLSSIKILIIILSEKINEQN